MTINSQVTFQMFKKVDIFLTNKLVFYMQFIEIQDIPTNKVFENDLIGSQIIAFPYLANSHIQKTNLKIETIEGIILK